MVLCIWGRCRHLAWFYSYLPPCCTEGTDTRPQHLPTLPWAMSVCVRKKWSSGSPGLLPGALASPPPHTHTHTPALPSPVLIFPFVCFAYTLPEMGAPTPFLLSLPLLTGTSGWGCWLGLQPREHLEAGFTEPHCSSGLFLSLTSSSTLAGDGTETKKSPSCALLFALIREPNSRQAEGTSHT